MIHLFPAVSASAAGSLSVFPHRLLNTPSGHKDSREESRESKQGVRFSPSNRINNLETTLLPSTGEALEILNKGLLKQQITNSRENIFNINSSNALHVLSRRTPLMNLMNPAQDEQTNHNK